MRMTPELLLGAWGAIVSTGVAFFTIRKTLRERPKIVITERLTNASVADETKDVHGVLVQVKHGDDLLWEEVNVEVQVANAGLQALQIVCVYVETPAHLMQIVPEGLPVVLEPNRTVFLSIQPEFLAPPAEAVPSGDIALTDHVLAVGVIDALGTKHSIPSSRVERLVASCATLPLRIRIYQHKETGNKVSAFAVKDRFQLVRKSAA